MRTEEGEGGGMSEEAMMDRMSAREGEGTEGIEEPAAMCSGRSSSEVWAKKQTRRAQDVPSLHSLKTRTTSKHEKGWECVTQGHDGERDN